MTDLDLDSLTAVAQAATPGDWKAVEGDLQGQPASEYVRTLLANREADGTSSGRLFLTLAANDIDPECGGEVVPALTGDGPRAEANATFIAAFDPPTALAVLDRLRAAEAQVQRVRALADEWERDWDEWDGSSETYTGRGARKGAASRLLATLDAATTPAAEASGEGDRG